MEDAMFRSELIKAAFLDEIGSIFAFKAGMTKTGQAEIPAAILRRLSRSALPILTETGLPGAGRAAARAAGVAARPASRATEEAMEDVLRAEGKLPPVDVGVGVRRAEAPVEGEIGIPGAALPPEGLPLGPIPPGVPGGPVASVAGRAAAAVGRGVRAVGGALSDEGRLMQRLRPWLAPAAVGGLGYALTGNPLVGLLGAGGMAAAGRLGRGISRLGGRGEDVLSRAERNVGEMTPEAIGAAGGREGVLVAEIAKIKELAKTSPELAARMLSANMPRYGLGLGVAVPAALGAGYFGLKGTKNLLMGDQESGLGTIPSLAAGVAGAYGTHKLLQGTDIPWLQGPLAQYGLPALAGLMTPQVVGSMVGG